MINDAKILVSIVVPIYKVEVYLERCLNSILNQTYSNIEIICVDDGSPDESGDIAERYAAKDKRIRVLHKKNEGLGLARNTGLEKCTGEYVTFIDSDDFIEKDFIEKLVKGVVEENADTVIAGYSRKRDDNIETINNPIGGQTYLGDSIINEVLYKMIGPKQKENDSINMAVWRVLYSLDIIKKHNLRFPSEREFISEDIIFDLAYYPCAQKVCGISNCGYVYCMNPGSLTERYNESRYEMGKILYFEELRLLNDLKCTEEAAFRAEAAFVRYTRYAIKSEVKYSMINGKKECVKNIQRIICDKTISLIIRKHNAQEKIIDRLIDFGIKLQMSKFIYIVLFIGYLIKGEIQKNDAERDYQM